MGPEKVQAAMSAVTPHLLAVMAANDCGAVRAAELVIIELQRAPESIALQHLLSCAAFDNEEARAA